MRPREFARLAAFSGLLAAFPTTALAQHGLAPDSTAFFLTPAMRASATPPPPPTLHKPDMPTLTLREPRGSGESSLLAPVALGLAGAFVCAVGGTYVGASGREFDSDDIPTGAVLGYLVGEPVGLASGVHAGNHFRGSYGADLGAATLGEIGSVGLGALTHSVVGALAGLGGQLLWTLAIERRDRDHGTGAQDAGGAAHGNPDPDAPDAHGRTPVGDTHARR